MVTKRQPSSGRPAGAKRAAAKKRPAPKRELSIFERIVEIGKSIPDEEIARFPRDGAENLDFYIYGSPKVTE